jgi:hypothetical protein
MPAGTCGAVVCESAASHQRQVRIRWVGAAQSRLAFGQILLSWKPAANGGMDVTAHLGLATDDVLLATWPGLVGDWSHVVRTTLYEVTGLCAAFTVAKAALHLANHIAE